MSFLISFALGMIVSSKFGWDQSRCLAIAILLNGVRMFRAQLVDTHTKKCRTCDPADIRGIIGIVSIGFGIILLVLVAIRDLPPNICR